MNEFPSQHKDEFESMMGYLNRLRESGTVNMFGASTYLAKEFGIPKSDAREVLVYWMEHFEEVKDIT